MRDTRIRGSRRTQEKRHLRSPLKDSALSSRGVSSGTSGESVRWECLPPYRFSQARKAKSVGVPLSPLWVSVLAAARWHTEQQLAGEQEEPCFHLVLVFQKAPCQQFLPVCPQQSYSDEKTLGAEA